MPEITLIVGPEADKIPGYLLWQVSKLWQRRLNGALGELGLSSTQAVILINVPRLNQEQRTVTQMLLAEVTKVDRMTVSQSIRSLERKGLVKRVVAATNKRAYHVAVTKIGGKVAMQALERIIAAHDAFFASLGQRAGEYITLMQELIKSNDLTEDTHETNS